MCGPFDFDDLSCKLLEGDHLSLSPSHFAFAASFSCDSHVLPHLERFIALSLACMEVPRLTEGNMPSANNAIWSMGEIIIRVRSVLFVLLRVLTRPVLKLLCAARGVAGLPECTEVIPQAAHAQELAQQDQRVVVVAAAVRVLGYLHVFLMCILTRFALERSKTSCSL
jgi:hypothetical protein